MTIALDYFLPYQKAWINDESDVAGGRKSRRVGFTHAHSFRSCGRRIKLETDEYYNSRDKDSAKLYLEDCKFFAKAFNVVAEDLGEQVIDEERDITAFVMKFKGRKRDPRIMAMSSRADAFRGKGGDVSLDEVAFQPNPREVLSVAQASALVWGHQVRFWSSEDTETNLFHRVCEEIKQGTRPGWSLHEVTILDAVRQGLCEKVLKLPVVIGQPTEKQLEIRNNWIAKLRSTCIDQTAWDREFMCIATSEADSLLTYDLIGACERSSDELKVTDDPRQLRTNATLYAGLDIGRKKDLTVFWVLEKVGDVFSTVLRKEFGKAMFAVQEEYLNLLMQQNIRRLCIDATGMGMMLAERAKQRFNYRVEPVTFTPAVKSDLAMPLVRLFEDRRIRVPADPSVREDLHKVKKIVTTSGNVRFDADRDEAGHADGFWSLALAYHAAGDRRVFAGPRSLAEKPEVFL